MHQPKHPFRKLAPWLLAAAAASALPSAWARNDRMLLPIEAALQHPDTRALLNAQMPMRFGSGSAAGVDAMPIQAHAAVDPYGAPNSNAGGARARKADAAVCLDAFRKALVDLQQRARVQGAVAVVGIVSNYNNMPLDSRDLYECRIGHTRGVVTLKGLPSQDARP